MMPQQRPRRQNLVKESRGVVSSWAFLAGRGITTRWTPILLALAAMIFPRPGHAEWLYFAIGGQVQAPILRQNGRILVETPTDRYTFRENDFRRIVPGGCPDQEWKARREAAVAAGADRQFAAAWWALENGLIAESVALLRAAHATDPRYEPTARLVKTLDRLERPVSDPETGSLGRALGVACEVERGPHVLLLHQHDPVEARARVDLLERVTTAYYLVLAAHGLDLAVPDHRLVSVYFRNQPDYLAFLESQGANAFRTTLGYYHPNFRAVVTFDPRPIGKSKAGRGRFSTPSSESPGNPQGASVDRVGDDLERRRLLSDLETCARFDGTAAHEMIHLLVIASGLAPDPGDFPLWVHEGFAAQFEVVRGGRWAGVGRAHDLRLPDWRSARSTASLERLIRDSGFGHGYRRALYAHSWSLVYFLQKTRPREFFVFLDLLRLPAPESQKADPARFESTFRSVFGDDLPALETEWHAFIDAIKTPLEENDQANGHALRGSDQGSSEKSRRKTAIQ